VVQLYCFLLPKGAECTIAARLAHVLAYLKEELVVKLKPCAELEALCDVWAQVMLSGVDHCAPYQAGDPATAVNLGCSAVQLRQWERSCARPVG
jgi:hypothetical protein